MPVIGLTGGIASGKSTVASLLRERGAVILDADEIARDLTRRGLPVLGEIRERFGCSVFAGDGSLDRAALGGLVFSDAGARVDLEAILHPSIFAELRRLIAESDPSAVIVVDAALLVESAPWETGELHLDALVVVDALPEDQIARLAAQRGMSEAEARQRIEAQIAGAERRGAADYVVDNSGSLDELQRQVGELCDRLALDQTATLME